VQLLAEWAQHTTLFLLTLDLRGHFIFKIRLFQAVDHDLGREVRCLSLGQHFGLAHVDQHESADMQWVVRVVDLLQNLTINDIGSQQLVLDDPMHRARQYE
jgi:hypothetical protein